MATIPILRSLLVAEHFLRLCRIWAKRYLITSQTRVKCLSWIHYPTILRRMVRWCIRRTRLTLACELLRYRLVQVRKNLKKTFRVGSPLITFLYVFLVCPIFRLTSLSLFYCCASVQTCDDEGNTYTEGDIWKKNCNRTTCECLSGEAQCGTVECALLRCLPGSRPGNPDPCGCTTECVGEWWIFLRLRTFLVLLQISRKSIQDAYPEEFESFFPFKLSSISL